MKIDIELETHQLTIPEIADWKQYHCPFTCPGAMVVKEYFGTELVVFQDQPFEKESASEKVIVISAGEMIVFKIVNFKPRVSHTFTLIEIERKPISVKYAEKCFEEERNKYKYS